MKAKIILNILVLLFITLIVNSCDSGSNSINNDKHIDTIRIDANTQIYLYDSIQNELTLNVTFKVPITGIFYFERRIDLIESYGFKVIGNNGTIFYKGDSLNTELNIFVRSIYSHFIESRTYT
ncbi:MAG: hypothetical protein NTW25_10355 [Candidatus Kapabacteria bacterium]|nr:hypothetical protein [Candidatus Kapabacteria bacterium]